MWNMSTRIVVGKCFLLLIIIFTLLVAFPMQNSYAGASVETPSISSVSSVNGTDIKIKWSGITDATGYRLYRSTSENGTYVQIKALSSTSYTDTGLTSGTLYYYKVRAYKKISGTNVYSNYSAFKVGVPLLVPFFTSVVSASNTKINLTWNAVTGVTGYKLYRSDSQSGTYTCIKTITTTSFKDTELTEGKVYYYKIRAYKTFKSGTFSGAYSQSKAAMPLSIPVITNASSISDTKISISWGAINGVTGYTIYRSSTTNGTYSEIKNVSSTNYTDTGLQSNTTYYYRIRCYKTINNISFKSSYSSYKDGKTLSPASTLAISDATAPSGNLNLGSYFTLRGVVSSNYTITSLTAGVYDNAGNATGEVKTVAPGATSYNLSSIDADIHFNYLPVGSGYEYRVTSSDASGTTKTLLSSNFNIITNSTLSISSETKPSGNLVWGSSFGLRGIIVSNFNIVSVRATVYTAAGVVTSEDYTVTPNTTSYDLNGPINANMVFGDLPVGDFTYKVWAKDSSGYDLILVQSNFTVVLPVSWGNMFTHSSMFIKQRTSTTCTLASAAMMLRRKAYLSGKSSFSGINEESLRPIAWNPGLAGTFNYSTGDITMRTTVYSPDGGSTWTIQGLTLTQKKSLFISLLNSHPEGIVIYNFSHPHAVLLTDYSGGVFYAADPASSAPTGRISLINTIIPGNTQDEVITNIDKIWYVTSSW